MKEDMIIGVEEAMQVLKDYPINADKCVKASMRKASQALVKDIKKKIPRYKKLVKYKVFGKYVMTAKIGLFDNRQSSDGKMRDWSKAYWSNYGTLEGRDPSHHFEKKVGQGRGGIRHRNFFDKSLEGGDRILIDAFNNELQKQAEKVLNVKGK